MSTLLIRLRHRQPTRRSDLFSPHRPLPSLWKLSPLQTHPTISIVTLALAHNVLWYHSLGATLYSTPYMVSLTQESAQHRNSSMPGSYGLVSMMMFDAGSQLREVSTCQGPETHQRSTLILPNPRLSFWYRPYRPSWTSTTISKIHLSPDMCW